MERWPIMGCPMALPHQHQDLCRPTSPPHIAHTPQPPAGQLQQPHQPPPSRKRPRASLGECPDGTPLPSEPAPQHKRTDLNPPLPLPPLEPPPEAGGRRRQATQASLSRPLRLRRRTRAPPAPWPGRLCPPPCASSVRPLARNSGSHGWPWPLGFPLGFGLGRRLLLVGPV